MVFKFTAVIRLLEDGDYEIYFPAIKGIKARGFTVIDAIEKGEMVLRGFLEGKINKGEDIPLDVKRVSVDTENSDEIIITKVVVFIDEKGTLEA